MVHPNTIKKEDGFYRLSGREEQDILAWEEEHGYVKYSDKAMKEYKSKYKRNEY